ncbi:unnamed protein product [Lathyrus sativus]|nr:unnamed protein product [Lathyrus sativus]
MNDSKNANPNPAKGYAEGPPAMAPPPQYALPPPKSQSTEFFEFCITALCCCCVLDGCFCDPSVLCMSCC